MKKLLLFSLIIYAHTSFGQEYTDSVFTEKYDNNLNCWEQFTNTSGVAQIHNGKFFMASSGLEPHMLFTHPFWVRWSYDFKVEARIIHDNTGRGRFGICWGMKKKDSYGLMCLNQKGVLTVSYINDKKEKVISQKIIDAPGTTEYVFSIERVKDRFIFYLNGRKTISTSANYFPTYGNGFAFYIEGTDHIQAEELTIQGRFQKMHLLPGSSNGITKENLGPAVNSDAEELCPLISADGKTLYFIRGNHPGNTGPALADDVWFTKKNADGKWENAKNIGAPINTSEHNTITCLSANNNIYLASLYNADGTIKGKGFSVSAKTGTGWSLPREVVIKNFDASSSNPFYHLSADKRFLIIATQGQDSKGKTDFYISFLEKDGTYSQPVHMGDVINTSETETTPFLAADNHTLYFSSNGHPGYGDNDIFVSYRLDDTWKNWSVPQNLGPLVNTCNWDAYFNFSERGEYAYMTSALSGDNRYDIFEVRLTDVLKPQSKKKKRK